MIDDSESPFEPKSDDNRLSGEQTSEQASEQSAEHISYPTSADQPPAYQPPAGRRSLAWLVAFCLVLSGIGGLAGGYLAIRIFPAELLPTPTTAAPNATSTAAAKATPTAAPTAPTTTGTLYLNPVSIVEIARIASPSVVVITTETLVTSQNLQQYVTAGAGSGVIYTADGLIMTNNHVIADAQKITVQLASGESFPATLIGTDVQMDIAVLKIAASGLKPAVIGDSSRLAVGDQVVAIGNPQQ